MSKTFSESLREENRKRKPPEKRPADERFDDHAPKQQQADPNKPLDEATIRERYHSHPDRDFAPDMS